MFTICQIKIKKEPTEKNYKTKNTSIHETKQQSQPYDSQKMPFEFKDFICLLFVKYFIDLHYPKKNDPLPSLFIGFTFDVLPKEKDDK